MYLNLKFYHGHNVCAEVLKDSSFYFGGVKEKMEVGGIDRVIEVELRLSVVTEDVRWGERDESGE